MSVKSYWYLLMFFSKKLCDFVNGSFSIKIFYQSLFAGINIDPGNAHGAHLANHLSDFRLGKKDIGITLKFVVFCKPDNFQFSIRGNEVK